MDRRKLKRIFADDPEMLGALSNLEQSDLMARIQMMKGDKGDKPVKGVDYFTNEERQELKDWVLAETADLVTPVKGRDYFTQEEVREFAAAVTPVKGRDYFDGKDADEGRILSSLRRYIPSMEEIASRVAVPKPDEESIARKAARLVPVPEAPTVEDVIRELKKKQHLEPKDIKGMPINMSDMRWHGGGLSAVSHDDTLTGDGTPSSPLSVVGGGSGTVTSFSFTDGNGFDGTVTNPNTAPALSIAVTASGVLKGDSGSIAPATPNTDYQVPITLTTTGTSGAATFDGTTLNIPQYSGGGSVSFGSQYEVPYTNATSDDFDYSADYTFDGTYLTAPILRSSSGDIRWFDNANADYGRITFSDSIYTLLGAGDTTQTVLEGGFANFSEDVTAATLTATTITANSSLTSPVIYGGSATTSDLNLRATSGSGTTSAFVFVQTGNNGGVENARFASDGTVFNEAGVNIDLRIEGDTDANLFFVDASTDRIGIGTGTPGYKLDLAGSGNTTAFKVSSANTSVDTMLLQGTGSNTYSSMGFLDYLGSQKGSFGYGNPSASFFTGLVFFQANASTDLALGAGGTERMRILSGGNVGINTGGTVGARLDVNGNAIIRSNANPGLTVGDGTFGYIKLGDGTFSKVAGSRWKMDNLEVSGGNYQNGIVFTQGGSNAGIWSAGTGIISFSNNITESMRLNASGDLGVGTTTISARIHSLSTTEQLRLGYDASNYLSVTVGSTGSVTLNLTGTSPEFTFSDPVNVPDEAYGSGWDGNTEVPTKNAIYDKIQALYPTTLTSGSVVFAGAGGILTQDNANFYWDDTSNRLGLGTTSPAYRLSLEQNGNSAFSALSVTNTSGGTGAYSIAQFFNDTANTAGFFFNSSGRTSDGGAGGFSFFNDAGSIRFRSAGTTIFATGGFPGTDRVQLATSVFSPVSNDGAALGSTSLSWSDLCLASGGVINFANSNYTLTHSSGVLTASNDLRVASVGTNANSVPTLTSTSTMTNKRMTKRIVSVSSSSTPTLNTDQADIAQIGALATDVSSFSTNLSGSPVAGDMLMYQITDNGTPRNLTWGASFASTTVALPTVTVASTLLRVLFQRNVANTVWDCIGVV